jgi:hypothetical protein
MRRAVLTVCVAAVLSVLPRSVEAAPIIGTQLIASGGSITAYFLGHTAAYTNELYLFSADDLSTPLPVTLQTGTLGAGLIFVNQTTAPLSSVDLGWFAPGTELVFGIYVRDTQRTYYLGSGARNPDGVAHGAVNSDPLPEFTAHGVTVPAGTILVGFEDLFGGGDLDYDDLVFSFSNVVSEPVVLLRQAPEPASLSLLALGLAAIGARRYRLPRA